MHLEGPWLSTTGKRKGKQKWASAEQKRRHEQLERDWLDLKKKWQVDEDRKRQRALAAKPLQTTSNNFRRTTARPPSLDTGHVGAVTSKPSPVYTGDKIIGIGTMHKSNAVPIFSDEQAKDISSMRR